AFDRVSHIDLIHPTPRAGKRFHRPLHRVIEPRVKLLVVTLMLVGACAIDDTAEYVQESATQYVDIADFASIDQGAWFDAIAKLNREFAALGQPYTPLTFFCSVSSK